MSSKLRSEQEYWNVGIGLNKVDDLTPSKYLLELSQKSIEGRLDCTPIENLLKEYYKTKPLDDFEINKEKQCDFVSLRIVQLFKNNEFEFSMNYLKQVHKYIFQDVFDDAGEIRKYNISKDEPILNGNTVDYAKYYDIEEYLLYDFNEVKNCDYSKIKDNNILIKHITKFVSDMWQVHAFGEGNTRTIAVFIIKYLESKGLDTNTSVFKENSKYFRNALVKSNYSNLQEEIYPDFKYLILFFENLLQGKNNRLEIA